MSWSSSTGWNSRGWGRAAAASGGTPALPVAWDGSHTVAASGSVALPASGGTGLTAAANDICLVMLSEGPAGGSGTITSPASGGTAYSLLKRTTVSAVHFSLWGRVLTSGDMSQGSSAIAFANGDSGGAIGAICYRGPGTFTAKPEGTSTATTILVPAFTPNALSAGTVILSIDLSNTGTPDSINPAGWAERLKIAPWTPSLNVIDQLSSPTGAATTLTYTSTTEKVAWPVELTP